ncbi:hypothetical protein A7X67_10835 [Clostridium sp. W14A]|nr:hypothetical protein A7X67_10835 [Clostridium sp. W14A]
MEPIAYQFKLTMDDYREMVFFSTFSFRKGQNIAVLIAWIAGSSAFLLDLAGIIELTETIHLCALMVAVTMPMLFVSALLRVRRFKRDGSAYRKRAHTVLLAKDGMQYRESGNYHTGKDNWDDIAYAFETSHLFMIFRTQNDAVLLPKRGVPEDLIEKTRVCLKEHLGVRFKIHCRAGSKNWKRTGKSGAAM